GGERSRRGEWDMRHGLRRTSWCMAIGAVIVVAGVGVWVGGERGAARAAADRSALRQVAAFELPGPAGKRFDYLTIDEDDNYLLSAHLGAGLLHVIDLRTNAVVQAVRDVPGVEGVAYMAEGRKVYTANWGDTPMGVVHLVSLVVIKKLPTET